MDSIARTAGPCVIGWAIAGCILVASVATGLYWYLLHQLTPGVALVSIVFFALCVFVCAVWALCLVCLVCLACGGGILALYARDGRGCATMACFGVITAHILVSGGSKFQKIERTHNRQKPIQALLSVASLWGLHVSVELYKSGATTCPMADGGGSDCTALVALFFVTGVQYTALYCVRTIVGLGWL